MLVGKKKDGFDRRDKAGDDNQDVDPQTLFRLPWTASDNAMTWLEPTRQCNIKCDACFHDNDPKSRKSLEEIDAEIRLMLRLRRCDAMLIAGGEPLTHPRIIEITEMVKSYGVKPVLITNGVGLEPGMVRELKHAGMYGFTFHVDAHQSRPGWQGKSERELNLLRQQYAEMLQDEGGLSCGFNVTVFPDTLRDVPCIVEWAHRNIDKVQVLTLIPVRMVAPDCPYDFYVGARRIDISETPYVSKEPYENLTSLDIYKEIRKVIPDYRFCAYLGGTASPASLKWIIGSHIGSMNKSYGNFGAKTMEILQNFHHLFTGRYLSYTKPNANRNAQLAFLFGLFDKEVRKAVKRYIFSALRSPSVLMDRLYVQSISAVQPVDFLPTGERDNCDGCPNKTVWEDRLVSACRLEEYLNYRAPVSSVPKAK